MKINWKMEKFVCTNCGFNGNPKTKIKGSFAIELILWLFFIVPGLIYSMWRLTTKEKVCPACGKNSMLPADTPRGQEILKKYKIVNKDNKVTKFSEHKNTTKEESKGKINWKAIIVLIGIPTTIVLFFIYIASLPPSENVYRLTEKDIEVLESLTPKPTKKPAVDNDQIIDEGAILDEKIASLAKIFCEVRSNLDSDYVNLEDFIEMYEKAGETVNLQRVIGIKPSMDSCEKIINICLKKWSEEECRGIAERKIWIGMEGHQLILSIGVPYRTNNSTYSWGVKSQWVYGDFGPYVYLEGSTKNDMRVTSWQD